MDLALGLDPGLQAAAGHDVVDGNLQAGDEAVALAEAILQAGEARVEGVDQLADGRALQRDLDRAAGQVCNRSSSLLSAAILDTGSFDR